MTFGIQLVTGPTSEPVSLAEAKSHLRVDYDDEDDLISALISASREVVEGKLRRAVFEQTYMLTLDQFPYPSGQLTKSPEQRDNYLFPSVYLADYAITLPKARVTAVQSIVFQGMNGSDLTYPAEQYSVDVNSEPARIVPINGATWPYITSYAPGTIKITFTAGQWDSDTVPTSVKQAMLLLIGHWYRNREAVTDTKLVTLPLAVECLLERWVFYGA